MNKYRIIKKEHYRTYSRSSIVYDVAYFVQVKYLLFYRDLKYWTGSDVDDYYMNITEPIRNNGWPAPFHYTKQKFPNDIKYDAGEYIFFLSLDAAKCFCERLKEQEKYIKEKLGSLRGIKTKTTEVIDMNDKKVEVKAKVEIDINIENKQEITKSLITEL